MKIVQFSLVAPPGDAIVGNEYDVSGEGIVGKVSVVGQGLSTNEAILRVTFVQPFANNGYSVISETNKLAENYEPFMSGAFVKRNHDMDFVVYQHSTEDRFVSVLVVGQ